MHKKKIAIVLMSAELLMDFAGPADVFRHANKRRDIYEIVLVSPSGEHIIGPAGIQIQCAALTAFPLWALRMLYLPMPALVNLQIC